MGASKRALASIKEFSSLADALLNLAETIGPQLEMEAGDVAAEMTLALGQFIARHADDDGRSEALKSIVSDLPIVVALVLAHDGDCDKVRSDMASRQDSLTQ